MTPILGAPSATADQAHGWLHSRDAPALAHDLIPTFWAICPQRGGVDPAVAFAQACKETGLFRFGGVIDATYHNTAGFKKASGGADNDPEAHHRFDTWDQGVTAHADHLALYAGASGYPRTDTPDPRHFNFLAGRCRSVEALGGNWAPNPDYGHSIIRGYLTPIHQTGAMRLLWLRDVLRRAGLEVIEVNDWVNRGANLTAVNGIVCHHTATGPNWSDMRVADLLANGRSDLPGPLSQLGLDRQGRYWLVAAGRANHNGYGEWGNQSIGIEAFNDGVGEEWPDAQLRSYVVGCAALVAHLRATPAQVKGHKETDPYRKIDPHGINMGWFRTQVAVALEGEEPMHEVAHVVACQLAFFGDTNPEGVVYWVAEMRNDRVDAQGVYRAHRGAWEQSQG